MVMCALTSNVQTVEETGDFLPVSFDAGDEGQRGPEESVALLGETQENYSGVSIQVFHWKGGRKDRKSLPREGQSHQTDLNYFYLL